jgi:hypothetical protein
MRDTCPNDRAERTAAMVKPILGVVAGLAVWLILASVAGLILRAAWPAYAQVATAMTFTLSMKIARLAIGALATVAAGVVARAVAGSTAAGVVVGAVLLVIFVPEHVQLWDKFPVWYHLTFLLSLVPLSYFGGTMVRSPLSSN